MSSYVAEALAPAERSRRRSEPLSLCLLLVAGLVVAADEEKKPATLSPAAEEARQVLEKELAPDSEARMMLDGILSGSRLGPGEGWFRVAVSSTQFSWDHVQAKFDGDRNGAIARDEFSGDDHDFAKLDRDGSGAIEATDLDWSEPGSSRAPGATVFLKSDLDGNGKLTADEFAKLFERLDTGQHGFLSLDEVRAWTSPQPEPADPRNTSRADGPDRSTLVLGLLRQEIGSLQAGPQLGDKAPDFTLRTLDGQAVTLSREIGGKPVVLIFGNFTCGPFRSQAGNLEKLVRRYEDRAKFLLVYVRESHPSDGWSMKSNERVGIELAQPATDHARRTVAERCRNHLALDIPFLVDDMKDTVGARYSGMPNRLYVIDGQGEIVFKSGRGPFGFKPAEMEQSLVWLLAVSKVNDAPKTKE